MVARVTSVRYFSILLCVVIIGAVQCQNVLTNTNWFNLCPKADREKELVMNKKIEQLESKVLDLTNGLKESRIEIQELSEKLDRQGNIQAENEYMNSKLVIAKSKLNKFTTTKTVQSEDEILIKRLDQLESKLNELHVNTTKPRNEYVNGLENTDLKNESMRRLDQIENTLNELTNKSKCKGMDKRILQLESILNEVKANNNEFNRKSVDKRLNQIEKKLAELSTNTNETRREVLDSWLDKVQSKLNALTSNTNESRREGVDRGLDQIERKLNELETNTNESRREGVDRRLDQIESKLNELATFTNESRRKGMDRRLDQKDCKLNELATDTNESRRENVDGRLNQIESTLNELATHSNESGCESVDRRLYQIENKLNELATNSNESKCDVVNGRLDQIEGKLNELATNTNGSRREVVDGRLNQIESQLSELATCTNVSRCGGHGGTYVRWGKTSCPSVTATLVYRGFTAGKKYDLYGSGTNILCLHNNPAGSFISSGKQWNRAYIFGGDTSWPWGHRRNYKAPCAVCRTKRPGVTLMVPGRNRCMLGWVKEYEGRLMASQDNEYGATEYICVDKYPDRVNSTGQRQFPLFYVEARCGTLDCPPYVDGREISCVVCTSQN